MKKFALATALLAMIGTANAYQYEVNGEAAYGHANDAGDNLEAMGVGGTATYYLTQVNSNNAPLAEAAFTSHASNVTAGYAYTQSLGENPDDKVHSFLVAGEFYIPGSDVMPMDLYAAGSVERAKFEGDNDNSFIYTAELGILPVPNLRLTAGVIGDKNTGDDDTNLMLSAKYLTQVDAMDLNLESRLVFSDDADLYHVAADLYLDKTLSLGASYTIVDTDFGKNPEVFEVTARKFLNNNMSVQVGAAYGNGLAAADTLAVVNQYLPTDADTLTLKAGFTYRF